MRRLIAAVLATLALTGVVFVAGAQGHKVKFESEVTAKFTKETKKQAATFDGVVTSTKAKCAKDRIVNLRLRNADNSSTRIAGDVTDANGVWVIQPETLANGTYFAAAKRKVLRKNTKHRHVCKTAISKDVKVAGVK